MPELQPARGEGCSAEGSGPGQQPGTENPWPQGPHSLGRRPACVRARDPAGGADRFLQAGVRQASARCPVTSFAGTQPCSSVYSSPPTAETPDWPPKPKTFTIKSVLTPGLGCQQPCLLWAVSWLPPRWSASACACGPGTAVPTAHSGA